MNHLETWAQFNTNENKNAVSFSKAYRTKNIQKKNALYQSTTHFLPEFSVAQSVSLGELLSSRARGPFPDGATKLFLHLYIYKLS